MTKVYYGRSLSSCTGDDCETRYDVLCYTEYNECEVSGLYQPLKWCTQPTPEIGNECTLVLDFPGPGCFTCVPDMFDTGIDTYESRGVCPPEDWP